MSDKTHPSEALLTTFNPSGFSSTLPKRGGSSLLTAIAFQLLAVVVMAPLAYLALTKPAPVDLMVATVLMGLLMQSFPVISFGSHVLKTAQQRVHLDTTHLRITNISSSGRETERTIELASIQAAFLVPTTSTSSPARLRIVFGDGKEEFLGCSQVPEASAVWLADQISRAARGAQERAVGEVDPDLLALLDAETRQEAERKMRLAGHAQKSPSR